MNFSAKEMIKKRRSVRTFDGNTLSEEDRKKFEDYISVYTNPFDVPVKFRLLDVDEYQLSSPVIVGANTYLAAKVKKEENYEIAFGYSFEEMCLYAMSLGIGTVMLAASLSRSAFEKAMNVQVGEVLPTASPVGYPAKKMSIREGLMRKGLKADHRIAFEELFFDTSFEKGLMKEAAGDYAEALEMTRLAPSATNRQPWRAVLAGDKVYFYEYKTLAESALGDIQKVDMGIALCHFDLTMKENGIAGKFVFDDPKIKVPENIYYIATYERV